MTNLKTLNDFESGRKNLSNDWVHKKELKAESIKWEKEVRDKWHSMRNEPNAFALWVFWFMRYIFNITEEDLK